jgi:hypothetical protein
MESRYINGFQMQLIKRVRIGSYNVIFYSAGYMKGVSVQCRTKNINFSGDYHFRTKEYINYTDLPQTVKQAVLTYIK